MDKVFQPHTVFVIQKKKGSHETEASLPYIWSVFFYVIANLETSSVFVVACHSFL